MAKSARIQVIKEATLPENEEGKWNLFLQWCLYVYDDGSSEKGYRFIWRKPDGNLQAARGQARIPDLNKAKKLINIAEEAGWGNYDGDNLSGDMKNTEIFQPIHLKSNIENKKIETSTGNSQYKIIYKMNDDGNTFDLSVDNGIEQETKTINAEDSLIDEKFFGKLFTFKISTDI